MQSTILESITVFQLQLIEKTLVRVSIVDKKPTIVCLLRGKERLGRKRRRVCHRSARFFNFPLPRFSRWWNASKRNQARKFNCFESIRRLPIISLATFLPFSSTIRSTKTVRQRSSVFGRDPKHDNRFYRECIFY